MQPTAQSVVEKRKSKLRRSEKDSSTGVSRNANSLPVAATARFSHLSHFVETEAEDRIPPMNPPKTRVQRGVREKRSGQLHHFRSPACERPALG